MVILSSVGSHGKLLLHHSHEDQIEWFFCSGCISVQRFEVVNLASVTCMDHCCFITAMRIKLTSFCSGCFSIPSHSSSVSFHWFIILQCDGCLEREGMAGLQGFACSHWRGSRAWLVIVEAPGYPRHTHSF